MDRVLVRWRCADCGADLFTNLEAWYRAEAAELCRFVRAEAANRRIPTSSLDPEEVVHDTFLDLDCQLHEVRHPGAWLRTVARRKVARVHHAQHRVASADIGTYLTEGGRLRWTSLDQPTADEWTREVVWMVEDAIAALPDRQRAAVYLSKVKELPYAEIAARLTVAESTVAVHVHRGVKTVRDRVLAELEKLASLRSDINVGGSTLDVLYAPPSRANMNLVARWWWCSCWRDIPVRTTVPLHRGYRRRADPLEASAADLDAIVRPTGRAKNGKSVAWRQSERERRLLARLSAEAPNRRRSSINGR